MKHNHVILDAYDKSGQTFGDELAHGFDRGVTGIAAEEAGVVDQDGIAAGHNEIGNCREFAQQRAVERATTGEQTGIVAIEPEQIRRSGISKDAGERFGRITFDYMDVGIFAKPAPGKCDERRRDLDRVEVAEQVGQRFGCVAKKSARFDEGACVNAPRLGAECGALDRVRRWIFPAGPSPAACRAKNQKGIPGRRQERNVVKQQRAGAELPERGVHGGEHSMALAPLTIRRRPDWAMRVSLVAVVALAVTTVMAAADDPTPPKPPQTLVTTRSWLNYQDSFQRYAQQLADLLSQTRSQLASAQADRDASQSKVSELQAKTDQLTQALADAQRQLVTSQSSLAYLQAQVDALTAEIATLKAIPPVTPPVDTPEMYLGPDQVVYFGKDNTKVGFTAGVVKLEQILGVWRQTNVNGDSWDWIAGAWVRVTKPVTDPTPAPDQSQQNQDSGPTTDPIPTTSNDSSVRAVHWMVQMGRYDAGNPRRATADYQGVEQEMLDFGFNVLVAYHDVMTDALGHYDGAIEAADAIAAKTGHGCLGFGSCWWDVDKAFTYISANANRPGVWKSVKGEILISGYWNDEGTGGDVLVARLRAAGIPVLYFPAAAAKRVGRGEVDTVTLDDAKSWGAQGSFNFYYGNLYTGDDWVMWSDKWLAECRNRGLTYMPHVIAHYSGMVPNWQHYFGHGYEDLQKQGDWLLKNKVNTFTFVSANDYQDGTAIETNGSGAPLIGGRAEPWWAGSLFIQANGFGRYFRRYNSAIANGGTLPPITQTEIFVAHTLHPRDHAKWTDLTDAQKQKLRDAGLMPVSPYGPVDGDKWATDAASYDTPAQYQDAVYVCVRAPTEGDTLTITANKATITFTLPAGESHRRLSAPNDTFTSDFYGDVRVQLNAPDGHTIFNGKSGLPITGDPLPGRRRVLARQLFP